MEDGWLDGDGLAPPVQGVFWLASMFARHYRSTAPIPCLYPTEKGNIQAEWDMKRREITLEINLNTHQGYWHELNVNTNVEHEHDLDIDSDGDWAWIAARLEAGE